MSGNAIDVLAVMDLCADVMDMSAREHLDLTGCQFAPGLRKARDIVAELIEAAGELSRDLEHAMALANFEKEGTVADDHPLRVSLNALDAALARIKEPQSP